MKHDLQAFMSYSIIAFSTWKTKNLSGSVNKDSNIFKRSGPLEEEKLNK